QFYHRELIRSRNDDYICHTQEIRNNDAEKYNENPVPRDAQRLIDQRADAIAGIDKIFVEQLKAQQVAYTRKGNLEIANRIAQVYLDFQPAYSSSVYLDDMRESKVKVLNKLGKHGKNFDDRDITVNGKVPDHSLFTHPAKDQFSSVTYRLNGSFEEFRGVAAIVDRTRPHSAMTFRILDGDKVLWESDPLTRSRRTEKFKIDIRGVFEITLQVKSHGWIGEAWAVWVDPELLK
ncbi:NPCBM/NEW2 domain-containing protein, partial [Haloferula sp. A504]|uniref:NPCBM/NEW2 domain-containing protein n=1 Tax=Haloferula sp. A504 TaxID=3373601 RepID=UPI0031BD023D|nr:NPCBM/NEW2 domain-containing protein [Verrucomicrobiaceae bacterium E54]